MSEPTAAATAAAQNIYKKANHVQAAQIRMIAKIIDEEFVDLLAAAEGLIEELKFPLSDDVPVAMAIETLVFSIEEVEGTNVSGIGLRVAE
ncbi:hypothetical protein LCGC14_0960460 [marine sediment metagenome]|uniref:Uncharacterized protein n=1 Tax=marine sediment metagenome TaxID=412755 RepID=A0A0F9P0T7_9ZZZZ